MKPHQPIWLSCLTLLPAIGSGASTQDLPFQVASSLPGEVVQRLSARSLDAFALTAHLNPYYLQGDFDGDGRRDTALLIRHKANGKIGIAIFQSSQPEPLVLGAGTRIGNGGDDFNWMDAWNVKLRGPVDRGAGEASLISLKGDALLVVKTEASSGLLYWTGSRYEWYQQGD
jgi:hypothetical protein